MNYNCVMVWGYSILASGEPPLEIQFEMELIQAGRRVSSVRYFSIPLGSDSRFIFPDSYTVCSNIPKYCTNIIMYVRVILPRGPYDPAVVLFQRLCYLVVVANKV